MSLDFHEEESSKYEWFKEEKLREEKLDTNQHFEEDSKQEQQTLFDNMDEFHVIKREWIDMPEFFQEDREPCQKIIMSFENVADIKSFGELIDQNITSKTLSLWYPKQTNLLEPKNWRYTDE